MTRRYAIAQASQESAQNARWPYPTRSKKTKAHYTIYEYPRSVNLEMSILAKSKAPRPLCEGTQACQASQLYPPVLPWNLSEVANDGGTYGAQLAMEW